MAELLAAEPEEAAAEAELEALEAAPLADDEAEEPDDGLPKVPPETLPLGEELDPAFWAALL